MEWGSELGVLGYTGKKTPQQSLGGWGSGLTGWEVLCISITAG